MRAGGKRRAAALLMVLAAGCSQRTTAVVPEPEADLSPSPEFLSGQQTFLGGHPRVAIGHFNLYLAESVEIGTPADARYWLGMCDLRLNRAMAALDHFEAALRSPGSAEVQALSLLAAGYAAYRANDLDRALAHYYRIAGPMLGLVPADEVLFRKALAHRRRGEWTESASLFHRAFTEYPDSPRAQQARQEFERPERYFTCQIGWFTKRANADRLAQRARRIGFAAAVEAGRRRGQTGFAVVVGRHATFRDAIRTLTGLRQAGFEAFVTP